MTIQHIGIQIKEDDLEPFYLGVLMGNIRNSSAIDETLSEQIFNIPSQTDIHYLQCDDVTLELFTHSTAITPNYMHICLKSAAAEHIYKNAISAGYKAFARKNTTGETYFIYDNNTNVFELKH